MYFFFAMNRDDELNALMSKVRLWHIAQLKQHKAELPKKEYELVRKACTDILRRAKQFYVAQDLRGLQSTNSEITYFILPWHVVIWYTIHGKKSGGN